MFGPELHVRSQPDAPLVLRAIKPHDLQTIPEVLAPEIADNISPKSAANLAELFAARQHSRHYEVLNNSPDILAWGIYDMAENRSRLVGYTALLYDRLDNSALAAGWTQAESALFLFDPRDRGRRLATRTHPLRSCFAFEAGVDMIRASTRITNERSFRAVVAAGYVVLGTIVENDQIRSDARLYNPALGALAAQHALATVEEVHRNDVVERLQASFAKTQAHQAMYEQAVREAMECDKGWHEFMERLEPSAQATTDAS